MATEFADDAAEEAAILEGARALRAFVPDSWRDRRLDGWAEQCRALEQAGEGD